jgi:hypothetical protein
MTKVQVSSSTFRELLLRIMNQSGGAAPLNRLELGLAVKDAGCLYQEAVLLAATSLLHEAAVLAPSHTETESAVAGAESDAATLTKETAFMESLAREIGVFEAAANSSAATGGTRVASGASLLLVGQFQHILDACEQLLGLVHSFGVANVWYEPPLMSGTDLKAVCVVLI